MQHFIVIGNPIKHSKSPELHQLFAKQVGLKIQYNRQYCPNNVESFSYLVQAFFNGGGVGANVTVPFKQVAHKLCEKTKDGLTAYAKAAGAVNTLYLNNGEICGHNTDGLGLVNHLKQLGWLGNSEIKKVAVIGAGGASRGTILPLVMAGVRHIHIANRTVSKAQALISDFKNQFTELDNHDELLNLKLSSSDLASVVFTSSTIDELIGDYDLIINATSIGLSGARLALVEGLSCRFAYDMMYGRELEFLQHFADKGSKTSDGYGMLVHQAILSFELWTQTQINTQSLALS